MTTTDTPLDVCPDCGARKLDYTNYICGTTYNIESRGNLCLEREKSKKLEAEVERLKEEYEAAAESVARMHEAAVGEIRGPSISVIDDIKAVRERAEKAESEVERLRKDRYPFQSFDQFCNFLTSTNLIDELAVSDPEGWDGGAELSRIETAYDRYLDQTNQ